ALSRVALSGCLYYGQTIIDELQFPTFRFDNPANALYEIHQRRCAEILVGAQADGDGILRCLLVADDEHVRDFLQLRVTHFGIHTLAPRVYLSTYVRGFERL